MSGDMKIRRAHASVEPLEEGSRKYDNRIRIGKTKRDWHSGAHNNRYSNRARRDAYFKAGSMHGGPNPVTKWPYGQSVPNIGD